MQSVTKRGLPRRSRRGGVGAVFLLARGRLDSPRDTVLKRYRVAAGSARPLRDYLLLRDYRHFHDYLLLRDPSYSTITVTSTTTSALAIPLWKSLPESRPTTTIPPRISLAESPPATTSRP